MKKILFPLLLTILLILTGCSSKVEEEPVSEDKNNISHNHLTGDLQEWTSSSEELPKFLDTQTEQMRQVYALAGSATEVLRWIPCYCGCGESAGHQSNLNCFVAETRKDGSIVWDDHGTRCIVCLEIAAQSVQLYSEGKSIKEIRETIDAQYKEGYAKPTPTDMPA